MKESRDTPTQTATPVHVPPVEQLGLHHALDAFIRDDMWEPKLRLYAELRHYICHEDTLINQRMNWLMVSQTICLAAAGALLEKYGTALVSVESLVLTGGLSVFGLLLSLISLVGQVAASRSINRLKRRYEQYFVDLGFPHLTGGGPRNSYWSGKIYYRGIPVLFALIWSTMLIWVLQAVDPGLWPF